jgi:hypothetical protein
LDSDRRLDDRRPIAEAFTGGSDSWVTLPVFD